MANRPYAPAWLHSLMMIFLYMTQGMAQGVSMSAGTYFLTRFPNDVTSATVATLSLPVYAFSIKWLWSPIIDGMFIVNPKYRRLFWILPAQLLMAGIFATFASYLPTDGDSDFVAQFAALSSAEKDKFFWTLSGAFFTLAAAAAIQDVAVDGWAIEGLPSDKAALAASSQTVGLICGSTTTVLFLLLSPKLPTQVYLFRYMVLAGVASFSAIPLCLLFVSIFGVPKLPKTEEDDLRKTPLTSHYVSLFKLVVSKQFRNMILLFTVIELPWATDSVRNTILVKQGYFGTDLLVVIDIIERLMEVGTASLVSQVIARRGADRVLTSSTKIAVGMIFLQVAGYVATMYLMTPTAAQDSADSMSGGVLAWILRTLQLDTWPFGWFAIIWLPQLIFAMLVHSFDFTAGSTLKVTLASQQKALAGSAITVLNAFGNFGRKWPTTVALYLHEPLLQAFGTANNKPSETPASTSTLDVVAQQFIGLVDAAKAALLRWVGDDSPSTARTIIEETSKQLSTDPVYLMLFVSLVIGILVLKFVAYPLIRSFRPLILQSMKNARKLD